jgi:hypothetical protein
MILYKKVFPLSKGISFLDYITVLRKMYFPNFVLTIDKIPLTENFRARIFFTAPLWKWGFANGFREGILLKECVIQSSKDERHFTLQASVIGWDLLIASFYIILPVLLFIFFLFFTITNKDTLSFNNLFYFVIFIVILSAPSTSTYLRDKKFLDKIGSIGTDLEKNK